jgi:hypothetical protein
VYGSITLLDGAEEGLYRGDKDMKKWNFEKALKEGVQLMERGGSEPRKKFILLACNKWLLCELLLRV